jgi:hypothetical protein
MPNVGAKPTAEADADWPRKDDGIVAWSGQAVAAVVGRRLSDGLGRAASVARPARRRKACLWRCAPQLPELRTEQQPKREERTSRGHLRPLLHPTAEWHGAAAPCHGLQRAMLRAEGRAPARL